MKYNYWPNTGSIIDLCNNNYTQELTEKIKIYKG